MTGHHGHRLLAQEVFEVAGPWLEPLAQDGCRGGALQAQGLDKQGVVTEGSRV